jgi:hypothetical protein
MVVVGGDGDGDEHAAAAALLLILDLDSLAPLAALGHDSARRHDSTAAAGARDDILAYVKALRQQHRDNLL